MLGMTKNALLSKTQNGMKKNIDTKEMATLNTPTLLKQYLLHFLTPPSLLNSVAPAAVVAAAAASTASGTATMAAH